MSDNYEKVKWYYDNGYWSLSKVYNAVGNGLQKMNIRKLQDLCIK